MSILWCHLRGHCRNLVKNSQAIRNIMHKGAYEGDGKTTMTILNRDADYGLMIDAINPIGFKLNIGLYIIGPMIIFPRSVIGWNIGSTNDIHEQSLTLFKIMEPRPDIIVLGLDKNYPRDTASIVDFKKIMKNLNINIEVLPVDKACTTFNYLNSEKRFVVGAFLPPQHLDNINRMTLEDVASRKVLGKNYREIGV